MIDERIPKEYIVDVERNGTKRRYATYRGILHLAHSTGGLKRLEPEIVQTPTEENGNRAIAKAIVKTDWGTFVEYGEATPKSVGSELVNYLICVACTRAKSRALRDAYNVKSVVYEELAPQNGKDKTQSAGKSACPYDGYAA